MSTIEKALGLLECFSATRPEIGLSEFKRLTGLDKGTVHRYLTALRDCGFLEQNQITKAYRLGPAVLRLAAVRERTVPLVKTAATHIEHVARQTRELAHAALPQAKGMSTLCAHDGGHSGTRVWFDEAEVLPFHATSSGLAMLAFGPAALLKRALTSALKTYTANTPANASALQEIIARTRTRGYAISEQLFEADVCSVAVPFFDQSGLAIGTLAVATPSARMTPAAQTRIIRLLCQTSTALSHSIGGQIPAPLASAWETASA